MARLPVSMAKPVQTMPKLPDFITTPAGVRLATYTWGHAPTAKQPREVVVLLHGFPDRALFWEQVAQALSAHCFVVAYDMRGCGASTPLQGRRHYEYGPLIDDLYAVIDAISPHQRVHLVGHDWGALYGWDALFDRRATDRLASFVTMAPSLNQMGWWMRTRLLKPTPGRLLELLHQGVVSNGLMAFFTLPLLPELVWRSGLGAALMRSLLRRFEGIHLQPHSGLAQDAIRYLGIYRANLWQQTLKPKAVTKTHIPVHALIAARDPFLPPRVFENCHAWVHRYSESKLDAAHWAPLSQAHALSATILNMTRTHANSSSITRAERHGCLYARHKAR